MNLIRYEYPTLPSFGEVDRLFARAVRDLALGGWDDGLPAVMPVDSYETAEAWELRFELPGVKREDLKVELENAVLTVRAERKVEDAGEGTTETLERSVSIPDGIEAGKIAAKLEHGLLTVTLPKADERRPRQIAIG